ncbi:hypothetical protein PENTCL1PPCAC_14638, partial [Pristionchus entomophagus]
SPCFLSLDAQHSYLIALRAIFACSMRLHCTSLIFILKFTPPNQAAWRKYMLFMQGWLIAFDVKVAILAEPVPLFPAPAGFPIGLLCGLGVPVQIMAGIGMMLVSNIATSIILCVLHRHQSIIVGVSRFRLGEV